MSLRAELIEAMDNAMSELPYDTLELRDWGQESISDPARVLAEVALDAALDMLYDNAEEWAEVAGSETFWPFDSALMLISALRAEVEE